METNGSNGPITAHNMDTTSVIAINTAETNTGMVDIHGSTEQQPETTNAETLATRTNTNSGSTPQARSIRFIHHHDGLGGM